MSRSKFKSIPKLVRTSELPVLLVTLLLPCLATVSPKLASTKAEVVEILKLFERSPPVPQLSIADPVKFGTSFALSISTFAIAVISSSVSPLMLKATINSLKS